MKRATAAKGHGSSRTSATQVITRVVGGTGFVAFSRKLDEPWQIVLSFALLVLLYLWPVFLAGVSAWFERWRLARGLAGLKRAAESLPAGLERSRLERNIQEIREADIDKQVGALKKLVDRDKPDTARATRRRSR